MTAPLQVLLVEDNPGDARLIEALLFEADEYLTGPDGGFRTAELTHVTDLGAALDHLETEPPDVVLLDLGLPDSEGMETLDRTLDATETVPVIVLTGRPESDLGIEAVRRGAQDYLVKGEIRPTRFAHAVQYAIERTKTQRELRQRTRELAILNQLMRHDVKNDISLVVGRGHELTEYVEARGEQLLAEVLTAANHVLQLTRTIGDTVETVTDESETDLRPVDPREVVIQQAEKARQLYGEAAVTVDGDLPDVRVAADELLSAVVGNLLSNALLYTTGDPDVRISLDADEDVVRLRVADNGPGVPDEHKDHIFGEGERGLEGQGTGIGLYLVDQLVDGYDGRVWVEDNEPTGAVFVVELARVAPETADLPGA
ncbi:hybrid sensor histidine kinase/response regulator [Halorarius litoreus]|uniref:hybrid sensor histidine kinase/response regulator n=1 Tax=Halorarius litoreus TaxID=2962676 RepID=UPI0020CB92EE|nr:hybrid sensor histidine kinase/response regulator [Halorarius litoreus]